MRQFFYLIAALLPIFGCQNNCSQISAYELDLKKMPVPEHISRCGELTSYLVTNYWERENNAIEMYSSESLLMEHSLAPYIATFSAMSTEEITTSLNTIFTQKSEYKQTIADIIIGWGEKYLTKHDSPYYSKDAYFSLLNYMVRNDYVDFFNKEKYRCMVDMYHKNMVGDKAPDFLFTLGDQKLSLSSVKTKFTLLVLYDNDTTGLMDIVNKTPYCNHIMAMKSRGALRLIAVSVGRVNMPNIPNYWSCSSYKEEIKRDKLYATDRLPALYLLDSNKKIILKDSSITDIDNYFKNL